MSKRKRNREFRGGLAAPLLQVLDSLVVLHGLSRGRSSSRKLRRTLMRMNALLLAPNLHPLWMSTRRRIQLIGPAVGSNVANGERSKEIRRAHKTTTAACPQTDGYSQKSYSTATNTGSLRQGQTEVLVLLGLQLT